MHWIAVHTFPDSTRMEWELSGDHYGGPVGVALSFAYFREDTTAREAQRDVARLLVEAKASWFSVRGNQWLIDGDKFRESIGALKNFEWLRSGAFSWFTGTILVRGEYERTASGYLHDSSAMVVAGHLQIVIERDSMEVQVEKPEDRRRRAFDERQFHERVVDASRELFAIGQFQDAIVRAEVTYEDAIRARLGSGSGAIGMDLMGEAFAEKKSAPPSLKVNAHATETEKSEQRGVHFLAMGAVAALRNPNAHELRTHAEPYTAEALGTISILFRYLDRVQ